MNFTKSLESIGLLNNLRKFHGISNREMCSGVQLLFKQLQCGHKAALAKAITLVESTKWEHKVQSKQLLTSVLKRNHEDSVWRKTFRLGISGPPGAGKSTFIESFGLLLTKTGLKVAVLAVDPSSATTGGSILGDKTRMPELSTNENAYIRASPASGHLGGATRSTNAAVALCEASGYDVIIVETVGVGQSEFAVADMVDMFALLIPPGGGDELQGIKRGIMEMCDIVVVNKSDGDMVPEARRVQYEYMSALKFIKPRAKSWRIPVMRVSSLKNEGIDKLWDTMAHFSESMKVSGQFLKRRRSQQKTWLWNHLMDSIVRNLKKNSEIRTALAQLENDVVDGKISPGHAADIIEDKFFHSLKKR